MTNIEIKKYSASEEKLIEKGATSPVQSQEASAKFWQALKSVVASQSQMPPLVRVSRDENLPLSFSQERLWFLDQLEPGNPFYNEPTAIRLKGALNAIALEQSLNEIVRRHESLRTTFIANADGQPVQAIAPVESAPQLTLALVDLRNIPDADREAIALQFAASEIRQPFDLTKGPLLRTTLVQLGEEEYLLLLSMHHIITDGWSVSVLLKELTALYSALSTNNPSPLPELPIQYADFANWQRHWLQGETLQAQLNYWKQQLSGNLPVLQLPTDRLRPAVQTYAGARHSLMLSEELTLKLKNISRQEGTTPFATLLAAFNTLLYRYTGHSDVLVGSPIANRTKSEIEKLIGCFINMLVLRTDLSQNPTFRELLGRVRQVVAGAIAHQNMPFEKLVEELQPIRDASRTPIFQVMFIFQNTPLPSLEFSGIRGNFVDVETGTAKFDLTLELREKEGKIGGCFEYNTDLFDASTVARMAQHFETLLEGIVANPDEQISNLPLLTASEQQTLLKWNDTLVDYAKDACVQQLIEAQARLTPDAIAVIFADQELTYQQLNAKANMLAHHLRSLGVGPDVLVGIYLERSLQMVVGLLAILKAGGAYVPLDPAYPQDRVALVLQDAQVQVLLTQESLVKTLPSHQARVVCLDTDWPSNQSQDNPITEVKAHNRAYVIYTSGSTGKPKGVQIIHSALVNFLNSMSQQPGLESEDILLAVTTISFDIAALELFLPLTLGACVAVASREVASDGRSLAAMLATSGATVMQATPATWRMLLEAGWMGSKNLKMLCGGEALPRELANRLLDLGGSLWNMYGPTETTIWSAACKVEVGSEPVRIAGAIANTQFYILDSHLQLVPVGVPGELHIGGVGLAKGYLNRPELTSEKFIPNPLTSSYEFLGLSSQLNTASTQNFIYKTGDLARYLPDGKIEFLGRTDYQVKIRGFRIELGEIEAILSQHPSVLETVVLAREDEPGDKRLVAYVVLKAEVAVASLRDFLKQHLPAYMVPAAFVVMENLPLTPNGKVDRRSLRAPDQNNRVPEGEMTDPCDALELQLTKIWEKVLGIQPIGVKDNFFDLGGHSLLAVRLLAQIKKILSKDLPLSTLFQTPTIEQLANLLRQEGGVTKWRSLLPIQTKGSKPPLFCIHTVGGHVYYYRHLWPYLGSDQPIYGLQAPGLDDQQLPYTCIEEMATHYLREMQTIQPEGPYYICGGSFGGLVAYAIAQQLHAIGQKVAFLGMFDSSSPNFHRHSRQLSDTASHHLSNLSEVGFKDKLNYILKRVEGRFKARRQQLEWGIKRLSMKFYQAIRLPMPSALLKFRVLDSNDQAAKNYVATVYPGRVTLFLASERLEYPDSDRFLGWGELAASGVEVIEVPGNHANMIVEPYVGILAEKLKAKLAQ